ncbi:nitrous oxide-stimulated promoter family protein [Treponema sp. Marseille-Q3903]|nr:nitrous oxide-stimulated promoter family protein [Treponema sp. Marseille-Q3903]
MARKGVWIPCIILAVIWIFHLGFFLFKVKTERPALTEEQITKKRKKEEYIVTQMIAIYCKKNHRELYDRRTKKLCPECEQIAKYSVERSEHCPHIKEKTFCSNCTTHCYSPQMRDKIKKIMRFSGPRIIFYHPVLAIWHLICMAEQKRKKND